MNAFERDYRGIDEDEELRRFAEEGAVDDQSVAERERLDSAPRKREVFPGDELAPHYPRHIADWEDERR